MHSRVDLAETLPRSVVHHDHLRLDRAEHRRRARAKQIPMTIRLPDGEGPDLVDGTRQRHLACPVEIGEVEKREFAESEEHPDVAAVLGRCGRLALSGGAERVGTAAVDCLRDELAIRRDDLRLHALERYRIAWLDRCPGGRRDLLVQIQAWTIDVFHRVAMVEVPTIGIILASAGKPPTWSA